MYNPKAIDNLLRIGEKELVLQVVSLYREHVPPKINGLSSLLQAKNFKDLERTAHSVKSSAGNLGLDDVLEAARQLEHAAAHEAETECSHSLDSLLQASQAANQSLNDLEKNLQS